MIHLYTGDGKGKTTAAIGLAVRAAGNSLPVCFAQFMKGSETGELHSLAQLPNVRILRSEKDFGFYRHMREEDKAALRQIHDAILDQLLEAAETAGLIVLDEITYPVNWGLVDVEKLRRLLQISKAELVLTGRDAADFLTDCADYVTEMRCVRHPYQRGVPARKGIEY
ncbi:MAG: cob(I)yrinic acid a,c-diamide adenosyltransferase [Lachnospiraceae bacterium]|nr:cob(I)yrinic acid a,c-diamide adenosyltransferase [Lachnospiraceae bacterium]